MEMRKGGFIDETSERQDLVACAWRRGGGCQGRGGKEEEEEEEDWQRCNASNCDNTNLQQGLFASYEK